MKATTTSTTTKNITKEGQTMQKTTAKQPYTLDVLTAYETAVLTAYNRNPNPDRISADPTVVKTMQAVGQWATYATLKKVNKASANPMTMRMQRDLTADLASNAARLYAIDNDHDIAYNADGDPATVYNDLHTYTPTLCAATLSDATDLLQTALLTIWTETVGVITGRPTDLESHWLTMPTAVRRLRKRVYIHDDPTAASAWEDVQVSPIQTVFRAIRRDIQASRAVQVNNKYVYLDDTVNDPDDPDRAERVYRRLDRLTASLAADDMTTDIYGDRAVATYATATPTAVDDADRIVSVLDLTTRQSTVLAYRLQGYGNKAIATRLGVTENSVKGAINNIRAKATAHGYTPHGNKPDDTDR